MTGSAALFPVMPEKSFVHKRILILADIEGSSDCHDYNATRFLGDGWPKACLGMTRDVNAAVQALFDSGVQNVTVKDFHRTGYNIFKSGLDPRANLISGYPTSPVPGIGDVSGLSGFIMLGMHAPSGSDGFLAHTLTSRVASLKINGMLLSEAQLFSLVLSHYGLVPIYFSGCPVACDQVRNTMNGVDTFSITEADKLNEKTRVIWRNQLKNSISECLTAPNTRPYHQEGPFKIEITFQSHIPVSKIASQWRVHYKRKTIFLDVADIRQMYQSVIRIIYLTPGLLRYLPFALPVYHLMGRAGLAYAKRRLTR